MSDRRYTRLFIDNISSHADIKELEHMLSSVGPVNSFHISHNSGYIEYENPKDAKYAIKKYDSYRFEGKRLGIEYAVKTSNKYIRSRRSEKERDMAQGRCFNCKERGHLARNCPLLKKRRSRSRSRSYSSSSRSRSRGKYHGKRHSKRSRSNSSRSYQRSEKSISRSRSRSSHHSKAENGKSKEKDVKEKEKSERKKSKKKSSSSSRSRSSQKS